MRKITSILIGVLFIGLAFGSDDSEKNNIKCDSTIEGYRDGYEMGKKSAWDTPEKYVRQCNNGVGMIGEIPSCWNEGFRQAIRERKEKNPSELFL